MLGSTFLRGVSFILVGNIYFSQPSHSECADLKGAPPLLSYLRSLLPLLGRSGATHLLVEYDGLRRPPASRNSAILGRAVSNGRTRRAGTRVR